MRNANGTPGLGFELDDYIDTQPCVAPTNAPEATGLGDLSSASSTVSNVSTTSGAFAPGQIVIGKGIPLAATIVAVGPGT